MSATKISWADATWNPIIGCSKCSPGCQNCYAERMARRLAGNPKTPQYKKVACGCTGQWTGETVLVESELDKPLHWRKPRVVAVSFMGDLFHDDADTDDVAAVLNVAAAARKHRFLFCTKRADIMAYRVGECCERPLPNVWLGVSAENQRRLVERMTNVVPLFDAGWQVWVSAEPMLGPIDFERPPGWYLSEPGPRLSWVVVGCESGPKRRPCRLEWIASVVEQCKAAGVPAYVKQAPVPRVSAKCLRGLRRDIRDGVARAMVDWDRGCEEFGSRVSREPSEWPEALRVRKYPWENEHDRTTKPLGN